MLVLMMVLLLLGPWRSDDPGTRHSYVCSSEGTEGILCNASFQIVHIAVPVWICHLESLSAMTPWILRLSKTPAKSSSQVAHVALIMCSLLSSFQSVL